MPVAAVSTVVGTVMTTGLLSIKSASSIWCNQRSPIASRIACLSEANVVAAVTAVAIRDLKAVMFDDVTVPENVADPSALIIDVGEAVPTLKPFHIIPELRPACTVPLDVTREPRAAPPAGFAPEIMLPANSAEPDAVKDIFLSPEAVPPRKD